MSRLFTREALNWIAPMALINLLFLLGLNLIVGLDVAILLILWANGWAHYWLGRFLGGSRDV